LYNNQITTLTGATFPSGLQTLNLYGNQITTLTGATFPSGLQTLYLYNNQITTLTGATFPSGLQALYLYNNQITTLTGATFPSGLQTLDLGGNQILQASVDFILGVLDTNGNSNGYVNVSGGSSQSPSIAGNIFKSSLQSKSWQVYTN
jgi:Leucine-rich repeat (LRR) protein